jgi:hypothetical protein
MWTTLNVYQFEDPTPVIVEPLTVDFEEYEEMVGEKETKNGQKLFIAYIHLVGSSPKNMREVREWARSSRVRIILGEAPGPTLSAVPVG